MREVPFLPEAVGYRDVCLAIDGSRSSSSSTSTSPPCIQLDVLAIFSYDAANWATEAAILERLNNETAWDRSIVGNGFQLDGAIGTPERDGSGAVVSADTLTFNFFLVGNTTLAEMQEEDASVLGWEQEWLDFFEVPPLAFSPVLLPSVFGRCSKVALSWRPHATSCSMAGAH